MHPTNNGSRFFIALYILSGVAIALAALGIIGMNLLEKREKRLFKRRVEKDRKRANKR